MGKFHLADFEPKPNSNWLKFEIKKVDDLLELGEQLVNKLLASLTDHGKENKRKQLEAMFCGRKPIKKVILPGMRTWEHFPIGSNVVYLDEFGKHKYGKVSIIEKNQIFIETEHGTTVVRGSYHSADVWRRSEYEILKKDPRLVKLLLAFAKNNNDVEFQKFLNLKGEF